MPPIARILLVVTVVAIGAATAMMFRKTDEKGVAAETSTPQNLALQSDKPRVVNDPTRTGKPLLREGAEGHPFTLSSDSPDRPAAVNHVDNNSLPPMRPPRIAPLSPLRPARPSRGNPLRDSWARRDVPFRGQTAAPLRQHKIVDGDTLTNLAEHYLGSQRRYTEIYEINRDVLPSIHALPIGSTLRIPARQAADVILP